MRVVSTTNDWLFGDFKQAIKRTNAVDVGLKTLDKETFVNDPHYHTSSTEYNYILEGKIVIEDITIIKGSVFIYEPYEISNISMASVILEHYIAYYDFDYVVELGSAYGALSTYMANMAGASERFIFETYDCFRDGHWSNKPMGGIGHWFDKVSTLSPLINSFNKDVFSDEVKQHILETSKNRKTLILCDGGDKVKEFALYSPILKGEDCLMVHDWGVEINQSDIDANNSHNLRLDTTFEPYFTTFETLWRPFIK
jgi:hypothetical protein